MATEYFLEGNTPMEADGERLLLFKIASSVNRTFIDPVTGAVVPGATTATYDATTGAMLVSMRSISPATDGIRAHTPEPTPDTFVGPITSTSTTFVNSEPIDCADYDRIAVFPNKTSGSVAGDALYKLQWSLDGTTNWFEDQIHAGTTATAQNQTITTAVAAGYATTQSYVRQKQARWCRVSQQSKTAATHVVDYHYSLL